MMVHTIAEPSAIGKVFGQYRIVSFLILEKEGSDRWENNLSI